MKQCYKRTRCLLCTMASISTLALALLLGGMLDDEFWLQQPTVNGTESKGLLRYCVTKTETKCYFYEKIFEFVRTKDKDDRGDHRDVILLAVTMSASFSFISIWLEFFCLANKKLNRFCTMCAITLTTSTSVIFSGGGMIYATIKLTKLCMACYSFVLICTGSCCMFLVFLLSFGCLFIKPQKVYEVKQRRCRDNFGIEDDYFAKYSIRVLRIDDGTSYE